MAGTLPPLLDSVVCGGTPGRSCFRAYRSNAAVPGIGDEPKSLKRLRSGDLLIETKSFLLAKYFLDCPVSIFPHKFLNSCRGVISEPDLLCTSEAEILQGFSDQGVTQSLYLCCITLSNKALSSSTGSMFSPSSAERSPVLETSTTSNTYPLHLRHPLPHPTPMLKTLLHLQQHIIENKTRKLEQGKEKKNY
ncbi:uncharacterized protein TNCV_4311651 [Trichonephila clavipes]|nr:uncharacterized protein TNCV_4311651 [Trichonephila clavipes]